MGRAFQAEGKASAKVWRWHDPASGQDGVSKGAGAGAGRPQRQHGLFLQVSEESLESDAQNSSPGCATELSEAPAGPQSPHLRNGT